MAAVVGIKQREDRAKAVRPAKRSLKSSRQEGMVPLTKVLAIRTWIWDEKMRRRRWSKMWGIGN